MPRSYPRPRFTREESWRYKRVKESWRSPKGKTSRMRRSKDGWPPIVKVGYARDKAHRGLHPSGLREVMIWRPKDLEGLDPKTHVARIAHTVGENKRVQIIDEAKKASIRILNPGLKRPTQPEVVPEQVPPETEKEAKEETAATPEERREKPERKKTAKRKSTKRKSGK